MAEREAGGAPQALTFEERGASVGCRRPTASNEIAYRGRRRATIRDMLQHDGKTMMEIDIPEVLAEVRMQFHRYEQALIANDIAVLNELFRDDPRTIRYGAAENLYGYREIAAFRSVRSSAGLPRALSRTVITTFGRDFAVASTLFERATAPGRSGRQMQTWVRFPEGWRVVAAHVSGIDAT